MASGLGGDFFAQFTPLIRDGRPVRADDGLLVFVRANDGEYVRFHDSQIHMEELERYIHNDMLAKASEAVSASDQQLDIHDSGIVQSPSSASSVMVQQQPQQQQPGQQRPSQQQQHMQVQLTASGPQMQVLTAQALQSLQSVLQMQVSQKEQHHQQNLVHSTVLQQSQQQQQLQHLQQQQMQQQQQHQQSPSTSQAYLSHQPLQLQNVQQQLQQHIHQLQQQQQQQHQQQQQPPPELVQQNQQPLPQTVPSDLKPHAVPDVSVELSEKQEMTDADGTGIVLDVPPVNSTVDPSVIPHSSLSSAMSSAGDSCGAPSMTTDAKQTYSADSNGATSRKSGGLQSRRLVHPSTPGPPSVGKTDQVWMNFKTPAHRLRDKQATQALIEIVSRPDTQAKFAHKQRKKKAIWQEIGEEMGRRGFVFENPGDKCSQKWRNIERTFKDYEISKQVPDMGAKRLPEFYDELSHLLKEKHTYDSILGGDGEDAGASNQQLIKEYVDMEVSSDISENRRPSSEACIFPDSSRSVLSSTPAASSASHDLAHMMEKEDIHVTDTDMEMFSTSTPHHHSSQPSSSPSTSQQHSAGSHHQGLSELLTAVCSQRKDINRLESLLTSIRELLEEQRRDRDQMRDESKQRFAELKSLIEQNQREKMKFMYDFLKTIQIGKGGTRKKGVCKSKQVSSDK